MSGTEDTPTTVGLARQLRWGLADYRHTIALRAAAARHPRLPAAWASGDGTTVVLLPGVYETWHHLRPLGDALNAAGHPVKVVGGLGINVRGIVDTAAGVWQAIVDADLTGVALVAHSKGGLVGKQLMAVHDVATPRRIDRLVAVATPFAGSRMAEYMPGVELRTFRPTGATVRRLGRERGVNSRIWSIAPEFDPHIPDGSALEGAAANVIVPGVVGHFRVLRDPGVADAVVTAVEAPAVV